MAGAGTGVLVCEVDGVGEVESGYTTESAPLVGYADVFFVGFPTDGVGPFSVGVAVGCVDVFDAEYGGDGEE